MRVIYFFMLLSMTLVIIELVKNLQLTKKIIKVALEKIDYLKEIIKRYEK